MTEQSLSSDSFNSAEALPKTYDPKGTECRWQHAWEECDAFHPDPEDHGESFSVGTEIISALHTPGHYYDSIVQQNNVLYTDS